MFVEHDWTGIASFETSWGVLSHEYVHVLSPGMPLIWLEEGFASYGSDLYTRHLGFEEHADQWLDRACRSDDIVDRSTWRAKLAGDQPFDGTEYYWTGFCAWHFLFEVLGHDDSLIADYWDASGAIPYTCGPSGCTAEDRRPVHDAAFEQTFGMPAEDWYESFDKWLTDE